MDNPKAYCKVTSLFIRDATEILERFPIKWKEEEARVLDIGCGDGSVTIKVLKKFIPKNFSNLVGFDVNENSVEYVREKYGSDQVQFIKLDIEKDVPPIEFKGFFHHIFSSYTFHWVTQQHAGFSNIYDMLTEGGSCLIMFLGHSSTHETVRQMSRKEEWRADLENSETRFLSPYHDSQNPEYELELIMRQIGFKDIHVTALQRTYVFDGGLDEYKRLLKCVIPFKSVKEDKWEKFINDYVILDHDAATFKYWLIVARGSK